jgi:predicted PurR-regulated permease PerM
MRPLPAVVYREQSLGPAPGQALVNGLVIFLAVCTILYFGAEILIPVALAVLLSILLAPLVSLLQRLRLPKTLAALTTVFLAFLVLSVIAAVVASTLTNLAADLPSYESSLREKAQNLKAMTSGGGTLERAANVLEDLRTELETQEPGAAGPVAEPKPIPVEVREPGFGPFDSVFAILGILVHPLTQLGIVVLMVTFILIYREDLRNRLIRLAGTGDLHRTTTALDEAGHRLSRLFATQLMINGMTGAFIGTALFFIGVPGAILWGVLTTVLRFVPYVGTFLASIFPIIIAVAVGDGWTLAFMTLGVVLVTETLVGHVLEPLFFGKSTGLSPVAIVAAAAFWTALWGPVGLVLATPITIVLLVVGRHIEALQFLEVLLGSTPVLTPDHAFYQRMLANDPVEAAEHAETYREKNELGKYLTEVVIPGLQLAQFDKDRKVLTAEREVSVVTTYSSLLDDIWPESDERADAASNVLLISAHGALNFAATLSVSAYLRLKNVPHRMLPEDAIMPGKFPEELAAGATYVCLCYLQSPSAAKYSYLEKRIAARLPDARILGLAWIDTEDGRTMINPEHAAGMLPSPVTSNAESVKSEAVQNSQLSPATL